MSLIEPIHCLQLLTYRSCKVYLVAYIYLTLPKLISTLASLCTGKITYERALEKIKKVLRNTAGTARLPFFLIRLVFTYHFSRLVLSRSLLAPHRTEVSALAATYFAYTAYKQAIVKKSSEPIAGSRLNNISSELTAVLAARALDALLRPALAHSKLIPSVIRNRGGDVMLFSASTSVIMFCWFYYPDRLQPRYQSWITKVAAMDDELVTALRLIRNKELIYGVPNPHDTMLADLCKRYGIDPDEGNTTKTVPIPCRLVHADRTPSCELHALWRFSRGFKAGMLIYVPLNLILMIKRGDKASWANLQKMLKAALKSSTFLASFIFLCW